MSRYIFEVQKLFNKPNEISRFEHVGYINKVFQSKKDAEKYYNDYNQHMQSLNRNNNDCSDWDPITKLRYIIREDKNKQKNIPEFKDKVLFKSDFFWYNLV